MNNKRYQYNRNAYIFVYRRKRFITFSVSETFSFYLTITAGSVPCNYYVAKKLTKNINTRLPLRSETNWNNNWIIEMFIFFQIQENSYFSWHLTLDGNELKTNLQQSVHRKSRPKIFPVNMFGDSLKSLAQFRKVLIKEISTLSYTIQR